MRKNRIVNILKNKFVAGVFVLALVVFGMVLFTDTYEVQATEMTENTVAFKSESLEVSKYFDEAGNRIAPKPTGDGYEDWIFAGWYKEADCINAVNSKSGKRWAKFVPSEVLSVKCQVTAQSVNNPTSSLRLVSTVDSLRYSKVGFEVSYEFGAQGLNIDTTNVYKKIESAFEGQEYDFSPNIFDLQSQYFVTATLTNINADNYGDGFFIKPYWVTLDGTKVYGVSRYARVEDSYLGIVNVPVRLYSNETVAGGEVVVDYSTLKSRDKQTDAFALYSVDGNASYDVGDIFSSVTISDDTTNKKVTCTLPNDVDATKADGMLVNLRFQKQSAGNTVLPKVNTFGVTASLTGENGASKDVVTSDSVYHYYHTEYTGVADQDWYDANKTEFVITSPDELYGFAKLVNNGTITTQKINLGSDISVNKNTIDTSAENWSTGLIQWVPIGESETNAFKGHFDGQGHVISGLCQTSTTSNFGLCSYASGDCIIENLSLSNSAFALTSGTTRMGSFVARAKGGTFRELYSEAKLESSYAYVGGILGTVEGEVEVSNVCFKGSIESTGNYDGLGVGGLVGWIQYGPATMKHCLNAGSVNISGAAATKWLGVGGLIGYIDNTANIKDEGQSPKVTVEDSFNVGHITTSSGGKSRVATLIGSVNSTQVTITNTYATKESCAIGDLAEYTDHNPLYQKGKTPTVTNVAMIDEATLYGIGGASNTELDFDNYWTIVDGDTPTLKTWLKQDGLYIPDSEWEGNGSQEKPWVIKTAEELYGLAESVNAGNPYEGKYFVLGADIKVNSGSASAWEKTPAKYNWVPIGNRTTTAFAGNFDGQGHTISGLYRVTSHNTLDGVGLFGQTAESSVVRDFKLVNSFFSYTGNKEGVFVGSIAGWGQGIIEDVYSDAYVSSNVIRQGGFVGYVQGDLLLSNCWFNGQVTAIANDVARAGGLVGDVYTGDLTIRHCLNNGAVHSNTTSANPRIGGIIGNVEGDTIIEDCLNTGKVDTNGPIGHVASIIGCNSKGIVSVRNTYAMKEACMEGLQDRTDNQGLFQGRYTEQTGFDFENVVLKAKADISGVNGYINTFLRFDKYWVAVDGDTPILQRHVLGERLVDLTGVDRIAGMSTKWMNDSAGSEEDPYILETAADLYGLASLVNGGNAFAGKYIVMANDITVNASNRDSWNSAPVNSWVAIGSQDTKPFAGTFDGKGYTISGLYTRETGSAQVGLFGKTTADSTIKNVSIKNSYFEYAGTTNFKFIGSVAAYGGGRFDTIYSDAIIKSNKFGAGGIVGATDMALTITNCWFAGNLTTTESSATYYARTGGILGYAQNCITEISHCLNTGQVYNSSKNTQIGGILGLATTNANMTIIDCVNAGTVNGNGVVNQVTSMVGRIAASATLSLEQCYATYESVTNMSSFSTTHISQNQHLYQNNGGTVMFENIAMVTSKAQTGYHDFNGINGYKYSRLDFETYWTAVQGGTPILTSFVDKESVVSIDGLDRIAGYSTSWINEATGTEEDPYVLENASDLYGFASLVNNGNNFAGKYIVLAKDIIINASSRDTWSKNAPLNSWTPIGTSTIQFAGNFNGQGYAISGVYQAKSANSGAYMGLFQYTTENCVIENLSLENSLFTFTGSNDYARMGSLVAWANGGIYRNLYSDTILKNNDRYTGGIIGLTNGEVTISSCWFNGEIQATSTKEYQGVGGILGWAAGGPVTIEHCLNSGKVHANISTSTSHAGVGGLIGIAGSTFNTTGSTEGPRVTIEDCLNVGTITTAGTISRLGTLVGSVVSEQVSITNSYATKESCGMPKLAALTDHQPLYQGSPNLKTAQNVAMLEEPVFYGAGAYEKFDGIYWTARVGNYPIPTVFAETGDYAVAATKDNYYPIDTTWEGAGTEESPYEISTAAELYGLASLSQRNSYDNTVFQLTADITVNQTLLDANTTEMTSYGWLPIGSATYPFKGTFKGDGHTVSGLYKNYNYTQDGAKRVGLFDTIEGAAIEGFTLDNTYFTYVYDGVHSAPTRIGSVAGVGSGSLSNIQSNASLISDTQGTGGILGVAVGDTTISNCWFGGKAVCKTTTQSSYLGGLIGFATTAGNVIVEHSHVSGDVLGGSYHVGGLIGNVQGAVQATITDSMFNGNFKASDDVSGDVFKHGQLVGTVVANSASATGGKAPSLTVSNCYGVNNFASYDVGALTSYTHTDETVYTPTITGSGNVSVKADRLIGYAGNTASLDYSGYWVLTKSGTPMLKSFVKENDVYDGSQLTSLFKLDTFSKTLANAEEVGAGRYTIKITGSTKAVYDQYCETLDAGIFDPYNNDQGSDLNGEGVYNKVYTSAACGDAANDDWCINATYLATSDSNGTITITVSSAEVLSQHLKADSIVSYAAEDGYTTSGLTPTFHMIEQKFQNPAASYVIQLSNGHLIVIDGGINSEAPYLMEYLESLVPEGNKPIIEAWVLSHAHMDHIDSFRGFVADASKYQGKVYLEGIYFSEASDVVMSTVNKGEEDGHHHYSAYINRIGSVFKTTTGKEPQVYRMYTGQRYTFDTVVMDVMLANEQFAWSDYQRAENVTSPSVFNETSTWTMFTINGKKLLTAGDSNYIGKEFVVNNYSEDYLTVDIFTALHHGENINREKGSSHVYPTNDDFSNAITVKGAVLYAYPTDWYQEQSKTTIMKRIKVFMELQVSKGMTGIAATYESGSTAGSNQEDYFYHGQGTVVLTFGDSITANVKAHNDWVNEYAPATTTTEE